MSKIKQSFNKNDVEIKSQKLICNGFCKIMLYHMRHRCFSGEWSKWYTREFMLKPKVAAALPYDPKHDQVVLIEQFRVGALDNTRPPWLIEIVAGIMDIQTENHRELIKREMIEETGLKIEKMVHICDYLATPGCSTEKIKLFCAKVDSTKAPKFCGLIHENEDIKIHVVPTKKAFAAVHSGQINNAVAIIALQWLELNLKNISKKWK